MVKQEEEKEAAGGQMRARTAGTLGIIVLGSCLGLQLMYAAFSLFGEKKIRPDDLHQFSQWGQLLYRPERELPIYLLGCLMAILVVLLLYRAWQKRLDLLSPDERGVFALAYSLECLLLTLAGTLCFFGLIFVERKALHRLPLALVATLLYFAAEWALLAHLLKRSRSFFTPLAQKWLARHSSEADNTFSTTRNAPRSRNNRIWDIGVLIALFLLLWVPNAHRQAGFVFTADHLHHWDYYAMAPAIGYTHGSALGTQVYSQYGVGWPLLFAALSPMLPLSYGNLIFVGMVYTLLYCLGIYAFLRYLFQDAKWAVGGVFLALLLMFYLSGVNENPWTTPSSMCLRTPCDIWIFFALLIHGRTRRAGALYVASVLLGVALLFGTDTGVYMSIAFGMYLLYYLLLPIRNGAMGETSASVQENGRRGEGSGSTRSRWTTCAICGGIVVAVLLAGLWIASRGTLFQSAFLLGWLEVFWMYPSGISMLPVFSSRIGAFTSFLFIGAYVGVVAWALICLQARQVTAMSGCLLSISVFGLLYMLQFIGRSSPLATLNVVLPFSLLLIIGVKAFAETFLSHAQGDEANPSRRSLSVWGWALAGIVVLGVLPTFRRYPSVLLSFIKSRPSATQPLLPATHDVLLPETYAAEVQQFVQTAQEIHALTAQGRRVAILSNDDTALYLASGTPLWCRYSPVLPSLITKAQQEEIASLLAAPTTDYVYILQQDPILDPPLKLPTTDTWNRLHDVLAAHYKRDHVVGKYEVWRK